MLIVFFDLKGPLFLDFKAHNSAVISRTLHAKIKNKYRSKFSDSIILLHNVTQKCGLHSSGPIECQVMGGALM